MSEKKNSDWSRWYLLSGEGIKRYRYVDGKKRWQRMPAKKYSHTKDPSELEAIVARENHRYETQLAAAKAAYDFKHLFISQAILDEFEALLAAEIPNKNVSKSLYTYLRRHCLHWFVNQLGCPDPMDWKLHERAWGLALLCKTDKPGLAIWSEPVHPDTIAKHVQVMNRFLKFLNSRMPKDVPYIVLEPISKAQARLYKAEYADESEVGRLIDDADWVTIERKMDKSILPLVQLGYYYGLRQSECLGELIVYEDALEVTSQLASLSLSGEATYSPLKNRARRSIPHWFKSAKHCYNFVECRQRMHPDTFYKKFQSEMARLNMSYGLHDLRRSFVTRAVRSGKLIRDVQLAAGHAVEATTQRYALDDRNLQRRRFVP